MRLHLPLALASFLLAGASLATLDDGAVERSSDDPPPSDDLSRRLREENSGLETRAREVSERLGALAKSGTLPTDEKALELLQQLVDELKEIRQHLKANEERIDALRADLEARTKPVSRLQADVQGLQRTRIGGYVQFQFADNDEPGRAVEGFSARRVRLSLSHAADPRTSLRMSYELATGTAQNEARLRDASISYRAVDGPGVGLTATAGQFSLPLGYEIARSSAEREFPERSIYVRRMFRGDRSRGVLARHALGPTSQAFLGTFNALTTEDPEHAGRLPSPQGRLAAIGGVRHAGRDFEAGLSGMLGSRPSFTAGDATSPEVERRYLFADASYSGIHGGRGYVRGEAMLGNDRVPGSSASAEAVATELSGWHAQAGYRMDPRNSLHLRYEQFDPNRNSAGNTVEMHGLSYLHDFGPQTRLMIAHEWVDDALRSPNRYSIWTLRVQLRF
jgi:polyhydroxyalkanoate synthesis regulator phasin